ncbi:MAG: hypothetical protein SGILL_008792 [Bacillariaceae sp.]
MLSRTRVAILAAAVALLNIETSVAFVNHNTAPSITVSQTTTSLFAESPCSRRDAFLGMAAAFGTAMVISPEQASAKYSDYSRREEDWQQRQKNGEIKISTARDLRRELAEIVPQNSEGSKVFCPNGPSSNVSPLMENKCSDVRTALPSVYGRSNDLMGNSIPGYSTGYDWSTGGGSSISAAAGGFPGYYKK